MCIRDRYDAGLLVTVETLVGILKGVIVSPTVYPRFLEFLHVDIQSTGRTLSRPCSRQPNEVMSEIECAQLHSEPFRRRHSTQQSHGLFALPKHLWEMTATLLMHYSSSVRHADSGRQAVRWSITHFLSSAHMCSRAYLWLNVCRKRQNAWNN